MKTVLKSILCIRPAMIFTAMVPPERKRMIFFGDSITELGTTKNGYISRMQQAMDTLHSAVSYELTGSGVGGNKIYDLYLRLEEDVLA